MKNFKFFAILAMCIAALSFTSCNSDSDGNGIQLPSTTEAQAMLSKIAGTHKAGVLFPGDTNYKIEKDSVGDLLCRVTTNDSTYVISNFPVKNFAKYVKDENLKKAIEALPNQDLKGKLYPYQYATSMFCTVTDNINFKTADGKDAAIALYAGLTNYSLAGYTQNKTFAIYLTPGGIYVDKKLQNDVLYMQTSSYYGGQVPFICVLQFASTNS